MKLGSLSSLLFHFLSELIRKAIWKCRIGMRTIFCTKIQLTACYHANNTNITFNLLNSHFPRRNDYNEIRQFPLTTVYSLQGKKE